MNRCPITYQECGNQKYSQQGLQLLSRHLKQNPDFPFTAAQQLMLAGKYATKLSIAGVQPKLSVRLNVAKHRFDVVEKRGTYIVKPPNLLFSELPENEDLTMRLAKTAGISVPFHCLIYGSDGSLSYLIKRFDRHGYGKKYAVEDFSQLLQHTRDTKYDSSMEELILVLDKHCSFPAIEKVKLFRLTLFCFLTGNEDMHLKNFSLLRCENLVELSPAYDLLNSSIVVDTADELALPLAGKRSKITKDILCHYYGMERLKLQKKVVDQEMSSLFAASQAWDKLIEQSFLSTENQQKYLSLLAKRRQKLFL